MASLPVKAKAVAPVEPVAVVAVATVLLAEPEVVKEKEVNGCDEVLPPSAPTGPVADPGLANENEANAVGVEEELVEEEVAEEKTAGAEADRNEGPVVVAANELEEEAAVGSGAGNPIDVVNSFDAGAEALLCVALVIACVDSLVLVMAEVLVVLAGAVEVVEGSPSGAVLEVRSLFSPNKDLTAVAVYISYQRKNR